MMNIVFLGFKDRIGRVFTSEKKKKREYVLSDDGK